MTEKVEDPMKVRTSLPAGLALAVAAFVLVACGQTDAGTTAKVKSQLAADDTVKAYLINVDTKEQVVTLTGTVDTAEAKERAVTIARGTEGVRDVVVAIDVPPSAVAPVGVEAGNIDTGAMTEPTPVPVPNP